MTKYSNYFPTLVWFLFGALTVYSIAPFVAKWVLIAAIVGVILVGMWIAGTRFDLEA